MLYLLGSQVKADDQVQPHGSHELGCRVRTFPRIVAMASLSSPNLLTRTSLPLYSATIGAIMKAVYLQEILTWDGTANAIKLTCWAMIECYLVIITASVPCLRSLVVSSVRQMFASDKSTTFPFTSSYRKKTATHQRMTNFEASGSRQNIFSGARGEDIEMGTTRASVNANGSEDGREGAPDGIGKTVDISITWEQGHGRDRTP